MNDHDRIVYVREEASNLLGRSIVLGFGFGLGFAAAWLVLLILASVLFKALIQSTFHVSF